ncbi:hypothetical protein [Acetobacter estunensis]|uniref:hypothetical protein n=1 Tax=Acetobacter estunensis TaxID=104097 RepID=UPI001C2DE40D|nr:hypothetical protein [Acetobacter estunensis]MBV1838723.1 hypothetical protein [Acetobacter estunensis]
MSDNGYSLPLDQAPQRKPVYRTRSGWAHDCEICGKGAPFGFDHPRGGMHWFCSEHREQGERKDESVLKRPSA